MVDELLNDSRKGTENPDKMTPIGVESRIVEAILLTEENAEEESPQGAIAGSGIRNGVELFIQMTSAISATRRIIGTF